MTPSARVFDLSVGDAPVLLSMPHVGTELSPGLDERLTQAAKQLPDTDWHVDRLYDFAASQLGATVLRARLSRTVIDLNRDPEGVSLYPGADTTELCPTTLFDKSPIYRGDSPEAVPDVGEIATRRDAYWQPYHDALREQLRRLRGIHSRVLLYDCHSIRSVVPRFFDGRLPDFNLGTADGASAAPQLAEAARAAVGAASGFTSVLNGRFKGGYITRHYAEPGDGVHAVQMEIGQAIYMDPEPPFAFDEGKAVTVRPVLRSVLDGLLGALAAMN